MPTAFSTIKTRVQNLVGSNVALSTTELEGLIQAEHESLVNDHSWPGRKIEAVITTKATYTTGTVSTSGTTVTGTSTVWDSTFAGRWIRLSTDSAFYKISTFVSATSLTMEAARAEGDLAAGATYTIFQHVYALPASFERIISLVGGKGTRYASALTELTRQELDRLDPNRQTTGSWTQYYSYRERDSTGAWQIELWPVPSAAFLLRAEGLKTNTLSAATDEPLYRSDVLVWKAGAAAAFLLWAKTGDQVWGGLADRYHTIYEKTLQNALLDELGKFSPATHIRDVYGRGHPFSTDFAVDHDVTG